MIFMVLLGQEIRFIVYCLIDLLHIIDMKTVSLFHYTTSVTFYSYIKLTD